MRRQRLHLADCIGLPLIASDCDGLPPIDCRCVVNDFTSLDQRYLDQLTRSLQNSKKHFQEVIVVHNCKTVMEQEVMDHIFHSQIWAIIA